MLNPIPFRLSGSGSGSGFLSSINYFLVSQFLIHRPFLILSKILSINHLPFHSFPYFFLIPSHFHIKFLSQLIPKVVTFSLLFQLFYRIYRWNYYRIDWELQESTQKDPEQSSKCCKFQLAFINYFLCCAFSIQSSFLILSQFLHRLLLNFFHNFLPRFFLFYFSSF